MLLKLRNAFFTGLIVILPLGVTIFILNFMLDRIGAPAGELFFGFLDRDLRAQTPMSILLRLVSTLVVLALITILGLCSRFVIANYFLHKVERLLDRVPFINAVYRTVKQIVDTFSKQKKAVFQEVVLLEYPRKGTYAIGFLTSVAKGEVQAKTGAETVNVFVPTTPNPTSGFLLMVPVDEISRMDMTVSEGMKLVISGGAVVPPWHPESAGASPEPVVVENPKLES
jgi:uncharacterized membrane protein